MIMGAWGLGRKRLPYDAEVEYLRRYNGTGIAVNTGIYISDNNFAIECDTKIDSVSARWAGPFNAYTAEPTECTRVIVYDRNLPVYYCGYRRQANSQTVIQNVDWRVPSLFRLEYKKLTVTPHGGNPVEYVLSDPSGTVGGGLQMKLSGAQCDCYFYGFRIYHDGELVLNYIPVKKSGIGYFYDSVSGSLVGIDPGASDQFIIGPDK